MTIAYARLPGPRRVVSASVRSSRTTVGHTARGRSWPISWPTRPRPATAAFALNELGATSGTRQRQGAYLAHVVATGGHPHLAAALTGVVPAPAAPAERFEEILSRILTGLLGPLYPPL